MRMSEVTLRRIISDYVHKRQQFKGRMVWVSGYAKEKIIVDLEREPFSQESIGYELLKEDEDVESLKGGGTK